MRKLLAFLLIALAPAGAFAVPVQYTLTFSANDVDADGGVGSFFWDAETHSLSSLTWDFGPGSTGGVLDAAANWSSHPISGLPGTQAEFTFEILTGENVYPVIDCGTLSPCSTSFSGSQLFGWPGLIAFGRTDAGIRVYSLFVSGFGSAAGAFSTPVPTAAVPEPGTGLLVAIGFAGLLLLYRRRTSRSR